MKVNLRKLISCIDATLNCDHRSCDVCKNIFGAVECPTRFYKDELENVLRIVEQYSDLTDKVEISEEELIDLLT